MSVNDIFHKEIGSVHDGVIFIIREQQVRHYSFCWSQFQYIAGTHISSKYIATIGGGFLHYSCSITGYPGVLRNAFFFLMVHFKIALMKNNQQNTVAKKILTGNHVLLP